MSRKGKVKVNGKQILMLGLVALVITAGYYRWTLEENQFESIPTSKEAVPVTGDGNQKKESIEKKAESVNIAKQKEERDRSRGELMEEWKKTAQSGEASAQAKKDAEEKLQKAMDAAEKETSIEILIQSKGYQDCFAQISDGGVTVVVSGGELNGSKVAQMKDIIVGETGVEVRKIKISSE